MHQNQDFDRGQIRAPFNQRSSPQDPAKWYFDQNSSGTSPYHPPTVENMMSRQSSPYVTQHLPERHFQHPPEKRNAKESYGYQNYGFQPIVPSEYDRGEMVPKAQMLIHNQAGLSKRIAKPMSSPSGLREPIRSQYLPVTDQVSTPYHQNERNVMQDLPRSMMPSPKLDYEYPEKGFSQNPKMQGYHGATMNTPRESSRQLKTSAMNMNHDKLVPGVNVQLVVDKHDESTTPEFSHHGSPGVIMTQSTGMFEKTEKVNTSLRPEISVEGTASVQPGGKISEEAHVDTYEYSEHQAPVFSTIQVIPETDVVSRKRNEASLSTPNKPTNSPTWYSEYRSTTPVAPEILEKVVYFQERINEGSKESSKDHQNEIKNSRGMPPPPTVSVPSPAAATSDDVPQVLTDKISTNDNLSHPVGVELGVDNTTQVCHILQVLYN